MSGNKGSETDRKTLGLVIMLMGVGTGLSLGVTQGWLFAFVGLAFVVLGLVFMTQTETDE